MQVSAQATQPTLSTPTSCLALPPVHIDQVRTWGILWRPCEVRLDHFTAVVNSVVRLHNFSRHRRVAVPASSYRAATPPVNFDADNFILGDYYDTAQQTHPGRPKADQVSLSVTREVIHSRLEAQGIMSGSREAIRNRLETEGTARPRFNIERNSSWRSSR